MDIDDPRLAEAHKIMTERVERYDERIVTVLKGHLSAEQSLDDLLRAASRRWKRRTFAGKIDVAQKLFFCPSSTSRCGQSLKPATSYATRSRTVIRKAQ
jgi:hypothetical protein